jgi:Fur family zinc uptake transcriptional regulator
MRRDDDLSVQRVLVRARRLCKRRGALLTAQRTAILKLLLREQHPLTAYTLRAMLGRLQHRLVSPITIYRALEFLMRQGLVAHLARRNAYVACQHVNHDHAHLVFVCTRCGSSVERTERTIERWVDRAARELGFVAEPITIEIEGLCENCRCA